MKAFFRIIYALFVVLTLVAAGGCISERAGGPRPAGATLTIDLGAVSGQGSGTRALTAAEDSGIRSLDLLAFKRNGAQYEFAYYSHAMFSRTDDDTYKARAEVEVVPGVDQLFVLVANAREQVRDIAPGTELETAQEGLVFTHAEPWSTTPGSFDPIPMYMRPAAPMCIETNAGDYRLSGKLIRMLARMDVNVKSSVDNFRLAEAYIFNRKDRGQVAYKSEDAACWDHTFEKALKPYIPAGVNTSFEHAAPYMAEDGKFERALYTFEARGRDDADFRDATALVVGGYYDYPANQSKVTYYRLDIPRVENGVTDPAKMGDILRNHCYEMRIAQVNGEGASTPPQAFFDCIKIEAEVLVWDMADVEVKWDMTHWIKVSQAAYHLLPDGTNRYSGAAVQSLDISSDYDGGWYADLYPADATNWIDFFEEDGATPLTFPLTVTGGHEAPDYNFRNLKFKVSKGDDWGHATIRIRCGGPKGKLAKYVDIYRADFTSGEIFDWSEADMGPGGEAVNIFRLGVSRGSYTLSRDKHEVVKLKVNTDYDGGYTVKADESWITVTSPATVTQTGSTTVTFDVAQNTTFAVRRGKIRIRAGTIEKVVHVTQTNEAPTPGELEAFPWENPLFDDNGGTNIGGPYTLNTGVTSCRSDGEAKTAIAIDVTADGRGDADKAAWTAAADVPWIDLTTATGPAPDGGATSQLVFNLEPTSADRQGIITVTLGTDRKKAQKQIKITQYPGAGITLGAIEPTYQVSAATQSKYHTITVTASHDGTAWLARADDPAALYMRRSAGTGETTGEPLVFSLLPQAAGNAYTITVYSPTREFTPRTVTINAVAVP